MTNRGDYEERCPSDASWIMVDEEPFSKNREPQFKDCNRSSVEQAAATSGAPAESHPIEDVHPSEQEDNYNPFQHYPGSLESGQTDATLRPTDNAEAPHEPTIVQEPGPIFAHAMPMVNLEPYLRRLPQRTHKDIQGWAAGSGAIFVPYAPEQESVRVEHGSANTSSSASHSRAGMQMISADVAVLGMGMWSGPIPTMRMSMMTISNTDSSHYGSKYRYGQ